MEHTLVLTLLGPDRAGIVETVSKTVSDCGGNWEQSRMSKLAGHFAGLARITCPAERIETLTQALRDLSSDTLAIQISPTSDTSEHSEGCIHEIDLIGNDRPGIVAAVSRTLREHSANILEIETCIRPAPESAISIFHTIATLSLPDTQDPAQLASALETLSPDLQVSLSTKSNPL